MSGEGPAVASRQRLSYKRNAALWMLLVYTGPNPFILSRPLCVCECVRACVCAGKKETSKGLKRHLVARLEAALWVPIPAVRRRKLMRCSGDSVKLKLLSLTAPFFLGLKLFLIKNKKKVLQITEPVPHQFLRLLLQVLETLFVCALCRAQLSAGCLEERGERPSPLCPP